MKHPGSGEYTPDKIPLRPIAGIAREVPPQPAPQPESPLSMPSEEVVPESRDQRARASASPSPKPAFPSGSKLISSAEKERHARRRSHHRKKRHQRRRLVWIAIAIFLAAAFGAGFLLKTVAAARRDAARGTAPASAESRAEALRLMDDAMRAKYDGRSDDALAAVRGAREADPDIPGADVVMAELALEAKQPGALRLAAEEALRRGQNPAEARLLLALERWMTRGAGPRSAEAVVAAKQLMAEASDAGLSNMTVMFFRGDIEHYGGNESEAWRFLLGALHRQQPWLSSAILAAKMRLAADEAGGMPDAALPPSAAGDALAAVRRAAHSGSDLRAPLAALRGVVTAWQMRNLLSDQALDGRDVPDAIRRIKNTPLKELPGGSLKGGMKFES